ncbi:MAG TPA: hypothetical protein VFX33_04025 [Actinomycetales bacterium]|nr:hypothetical protein [Actinomycetales bacterium]
MADETDSTDLSRQQHVRDVVLVVDVANVLGTRPDGWWRDRLGATERLLKSLPLLDGADIVTPDGSPCVLRGLVAVLEGKARNARVPDGVVPVRATGSGDDALVSYVEHETAQADNPLVVVTADRGLRQRLPEVVQVLGPGWLRDRLDALERG